jgi:hypothetical protein
MDCLKHAFTALACTHAMTREPPSASSPPGGSRRSSSPPSSPGRTAFTAGTAPGTRVVGIGFLLLACATECLYVVMLAHMLFDAMIFAGG